MPPFEIGAWRPARRSLRPARATGAWSGISSVAQQLVGRDRAAASERHDPGVELAPRDFGRASHRPAARHHRRPMGAVPLEPSDPRSVRLMRASRGHAGPPAPFTPDLPCVSRRTSRAFHAELQTRTSVRFTPYFPSLRGLPCSDLGALGTGPQRYLTMTFVSALCPVASLTMISCAPRVSGQRMVSSRPAVPIEAPLTNHSSEPAAALGAQRQRLELRPQRRIDQIHRAGERRHDRESQRDRRCARLGRRRRGAAAVALIADAAAAGVTSRSSPARASPNAGTVRGQTVTTP